jgi:DHA1 family multidrug resistance protein-like MFS transporter
MTELLREAPLGQLIRYFSGNRFLKYPEELSSFGLPPEYRNVLNSASDQKVEPGPVDSEGRSESSESSRTSSKDVISPISASDATNVEKEKQAPHLNEHDDKTLRLTKSLSRANSRPYTAERLEIEAELAIERAHSRSIVPQLTADGYILVDWYTSDDQANPQNWSNGKRFVVAFVIGLYTWVVYSGSAIVTSSEPAIIEKFHVGPTTASLPLSLYVLAYGIGPLLWSPLTEIPSIGRSPVYAVTMALYTILSLPTAMVDNFPGLLVLRFLQGFLGSPCLATGGATMQDIYSLLYLPFAL